MSIITPTYNSELYIEDTIKSVINQTYKNWEMVIIDDNSTDNTVEIINKYISKEARIRLFHNSKNGGVSKARNKGLDLANGKYIAFLDSDDLWNKDKLKKQIEFMKINGYYITYTAFEKFYTNNDRSRKKIFIPKKMESNDILKNTIIGCLTVVIDRQEVGDFKMPLISHSEDQCTWLEIVSRGFTAYGLNEILAYYRISNNSLSNNKIKAARKQWEVYRKVHKLPITKSLYYYCCYAFNAIRR